MDQSDRAIECGRLNEAEIESLLNEMDASESSTDSNRRDHIRFKYRRHRCLLKITDNSRVGGKFYYVSFRNISEKGICCLHGGFIYANTRCFVELERLTGEKDRVAGIVRRCSYVGHGLHEVGIEFNNMLDIGAYVEGLDTIRVLIVDDDRDMRRLARHYVTGMSAEIAEARNGVEALKIANRENFDLILMDLDMPKMDGFEAIAKLRTAGFDGMIAAVTGLTDFAVKERCLLAGADTVVMKPVLRKTIDALFEKMGAPPILSEFMNEPIMKHRVRNFIGSVPGVVRQFEETYSETTRGHYDALDTLCGELRMNAAAHGYPYLSSAAGDLQLAIRFNLEKSAIKEAVTDLVNECMKVWMGGRRLAEF